MPAPFVTETGRPAFDLQAHSVHSDGTLPPAEVIARAARAGVELLALSDHDSVAGITQAAAAAHREGIRLLPAAELSAVHDGHEDLHVLGYGIDPDDATLRDRLADARADRERRILAMADRLRDLGWTVDPARLRVRGALGRPHLARAVLEDPANATRLDEENVASADLLFPAYLVPGAPAYVPRERPDVPAAIAWIHDADGAAVWAHPFWDMEDPEEVRATLAGFAAAGLDGVEAFYVTHTQAQTVALASEADRAGLLATGSSDFHGPDHPRFNSFLAFELFGAEPRLPL